MFAMFDKYDDVCWESFPLWYRSSVHMTLDENVIPHVENANRRDDASHNLSMALTSVMENNEVKTHEETNVQTDSPNPICLKKTIDSIASILFKIRNVSFDISSLDALKETESSLQSVLDKMLHLCNHDSGLRLSAGAAKKSQQVKRKASSQYNALPRKYPKVNRFASRFGLSAKSDTMVVGTSTIQFENSDKNKRKRY